MTNATRISAAIEKLERLKAESTEGVWFESNGIMGIETGMEDVVLDAGMSTYDADLIVTLHSTIDAQLELLRLALKYGELDASSGSRFIAGAVKLADAILGKG